MKVRTKPPAPVLASIPQTPDLPMMEDCDRRVSICAPPRPLPPVAEAKVVHKATSMANLGSKDRERTRTSVIPPTPSPAVPSQSAMRRTSSLRAPVITTPVATPSHSSIAFSATLLDIVQRPAPTTTDQVFIKLEFGFSLAERSDTSAITLPLETLQRAGGYLERFVRGHLEDMKDRADKAADEERGLRIVSDVPSYGSKPGMTDGESGTESDLESEEYGSSALLR